MKKKQLHIVNKYFYPVVAGIETCLLETYSRFNLDDWDITVHTSTDTLTDEGVLPRHDTIRGIAIRRYRTNYDIFFPRLPLNTADVVLLNNFSLIPIFPIITLTFVFKLIGRKRTVLVLAPHGGYTPAWMQFGIGKRTIKRLVHSIGGKLINHVVDAVQAVSEWEKEQMIATGIHPSLISVIPNGVEEIAFDTNALISDHAKSLAKQAGQYFVMLSRLHPIKNIEMAINAFQYVKEPYKLLILGKYEYPAYHERLKSLIHNLNLDERIVLADQIIQADKYYLLRNAVAMVHTSTYEVDPIAIKEGLSQGLICIACNNTGTARLIHDGVNGFLVETNNHIQLSEKLAYVVDHMNSTKLLAMKKHNLETRKQYRWDRTASQVEQLFEQLTT